MESFQGSCSTHSINEIQQWNPGEGGCPTERVEIKERLGISRRPLI